MSKQSFRNQFLISLPSLKGDYFQKTVSLLIEHNDEGALGLVINQPIDNQIHHIFPQLEADSKIPVLLGGPVRQDSIFFLHPTGPKFDATTEISDEISLTRSEDFVDAIKSGDAPEKTIVLLGYAGWSAQQLEQEIAADVWLLSPTAGRVVFDVPYSKRASEAAKLLGIDLYLISPQAGHD